MKRHRALIALSHHHHHALVEARRLRRAGKADDAAGAVAAFIHFFRTVTVPHFREEEEDLFPLVAASEEARPLLVEALLDHQHLHALVRRLERSADVRPIMRELGERFDAHVRLEERQLFPLIERLAAAELDTAAEAEGGRGGPVWGQASADLNATLLAWGAGAGPPEHVNDERDVLILVVDGTAAIAIDGEQSELSAGEAVIVEKGRRRQITGGRAGVRYVSVHTRRPPLQIQPSPSRVG